MKQGLKGILYLTQKEYLVLSALTGITKMRGVFIDDALVLSDKDVYYACFALAKKKIVDEKRQVKEPYKSLFEGMRDAKKQLLSYGDLRDPLREMTICYLGKDACVISRVSHSDAEAISVYEVTRKQLLEELTELSCLPEGTDEKENSTATQTFSADDFVWLAEDAAPLHLSPRVETRNVFIVKDENASKNLAWLWLDGGEGARMVRIEEEAVQVYTADAYVAVFQKDLEDEA